MGWANCGRDERGRKIGYAFVAKCDAPGCKVKIDRGLSYVCGGMHGGDGIGCGGYFCSAHRVDVELNDGDYKMVCSPCEAILKAEGCLAREDEDLDAA